jgi:hypothetical protein
VLLIILLKISRINEQQEEISMKVREGKETTDMKEETDI